jgi:hypothetical protein
LHKVFSNLTVLLLLLLVLLLVVCSTYVITILRLKKNGPSLPRHYLLISAGAGLLVLVGRITTNHSGRYHIIVHIHHVVNGSFELHCNSSSSATNLFSPLCLVVVVVVVLSMIAMAALLTMIMQRTIRPPTTTGGEVFSPLVVEIEGITISGIPVGKNETSSSHLCR